MKRIVLLLLILKIGTGFAQQKIKSPDGKIEVIVEYKDQLQFLTFVNGRNLIKKGVISLKLSGETLGKAPELLRVKRRNSNAKVKPVVPLKFSELSDRYNEITLFFKGDYAVQFRVYDQGFAYRFTTSKPGTITVVSEQSDFEFSDNYKTYVAKTTEKFSSFEHVFKPVWLYDLQKKDLLVIPAYVDARDTKVLLAEADLYDYPAWFVRGGKGNKITGWQPKFVEKTVPITNSWWADRRLAIVKEADYIAKTRGTRSFPWRVFAMGEKDADIAKNNLVYLLSRPSGYHDFSWIKPGKTSWEWWHANNIIGVDFKSGLNTKTYKYYIDFADKYDLEYVLLDEGWSKGVTDISEPNPEIDLEELMRYAAKRNVKLILWASWLTVENTPEFFEQVHKMGVAGVKIDFMDRSDQWMINFYERMAKRAFDNKLLVDFHGSITPRGLRRAYPNIISYEGLIGMEQNKMNGTDTPENRVVLPFTRNVVGPMDYTPGAMRSVQPKYWHANWNNPMSIGTRAHQLALYVVFESGLQMLADNPSYYYKEDECTRYIASVPTVWDETVVIDGQIGSHYIVAKRKGNEWFLGGITNKNEREISFDLSFLKSGRYQLELFTDGVNADKNAIDYAKTVRQITASDTLKIKMVQNGGFAVKISPLK